MRVRTYLSAILVVSTFIASGCFRQDRRTIDVAVPQLASEDCFRIIQEGLRAVEGIEGATPNYEARTVAVTYNAMKLGIKNIEAVIATAGFDANTTPAPADIRARLPEGCR